MMGRGHALTGVLFAVGTARYMSADVPTLVAICTSLPGAALLPDIDHAKATVSNTFGPLTRAFSYVLGHRRETHSIPGILSIGLFIGVCVSLRHADVHPGIVLGANAVLTFVLVLIWSSVIRLFKIRGKIDDYAPVPFAVMIVYFPDVLGSVGLPPFPFEVLGPVIVLGMLIHVVGDLLTKQGCPLLWPLSAKRTAFGWFKAGGWVERWIITPVLIAGIIWQLAVWITGLA